MDERAVDLAEGELRNEISETLIEPQIVPPVHGDKIAEPMMSQLVSESVC